MFRNGDIRRHDFRLVNGVDSASTQSGFAFRACFDLVRRRVRDQLASFVSLVATALIRFVLGCAFSLKFFSSSSDRFDRSGRDSIGIGLPSGPLTSLATTSLQPSRFLARKMEAATLPALVRRNRFRRTDTRPLALAAPSRR